MRRKRIAQMCKDSAPLRRAALQPRSAAALQRRTAQRNAAQRSAAAAARHSQHAAQHQHRTVQSDGHATRGNRHPKKSTALLETTQLRRPGRSSTRTTTPHHNRSARTGPSATVLAPSAASTAANLRLCSDTKRSVSCTWWSTSDPSGRVSASNKDASPLNVAMGGARRGHEAENQLGAEASGLSRPTYCALAGLNRVNR